MHDLMTLISGCGGPVFSDVPTNPAQITPKSLNRVSSHILDPKNKARLQTPQNRGFSFWHPELGIDWQD